MNKILIPLALSYLGVMSPAIAASFDCSKAKGFDEKTICSSPKLSKDDDDLKYLFRYAQASVQDHKAFSEITKALWNSRARCSDYKCVDAWYDTAFAIYETIKLKGIPETNGATDFTSVPEVDSTKNNQASNSKSKSNNGAKRDFSLFDSNDRSAPIEHDAVLYSESEDALKLIDSLVELVRKNSFRCDTVSSFSPMIGVNGYSISCNKFGYKYKIKDTGGGVIVAVDN